MRISRLLILMLMFCPFLSSSFAQERISSEGVDVYEGVLRIKFDTQTVDGFSSIQMKSTSSNAPAVYTTGITSIDMVNSNPNVFTFSRLFPYSPTHEAKHREYGLHQWYEVKFDTEVGVEAMMDNYANLDGIEVIKPVFQKTGVGFDQNPVTLTAGQVRKLQEVKSKSLTTDNYYPFDDPFLENQWHYENYGDVAGSEDSDIDLFGAWKTETGNDSVIVAIIDGGIDYRHEDLADAMWVNELELDGLDGVDDDENGFVDDIYGYNFYSDQGPITPILHGTHVAGTVGAVNNNGIGVCGVAGGGEIDGGTSPGVRLMSCQIFTEADGSNGTEGAYVYAADNGAVIAQSSWSYTSAGYFEEEVMTAIDYFYNEAGNFKGSKVLGGLLFFSAGNNSTEGNFYPAVYDKVIGITATGPFDLPSSYTNYGPAYDIAAPGGDFLDDGTDLGGVLSTSPDNSYAYLNGTSMSTPHVSGVAALILANSTDKTLTNEDVYATILDLTAPFSTNDVYGNYEGNMGVGHLNALYCLLDNEGIDPEPVGDFRLTDITHNKVIMEWQIPVDSDDIKPTSYHVYLGYEEFTADDLSTAEQFSLLYDGNVGDTVTATMQGLDSETEMWFAAQAVDFWGNTSTVSDVIKCKTLSAPIFHMEDHTFMFHVDATKSLYADTVISLYNRGEGLLEWSTDVANYNFLFPSMIDSTRWFTDAEMENTTASTVNAMKSSLIEDNTILSKPVIPGTYVETDYLDQTIYTSALYSDATDVGPEAVIGDYKTDQRVVQATRFQVPLDYNFTLTHVEAWIYHTEGKSPIKMEVRTGRDLGSSELAYQRYYTPDSTDLQLVRIPLERPLIMQDGVYFWLLLSHPEKETMPVVTNYMDILYGSSYLSTDGGYSWDDFSDVCGYSPQQMKIRAYSVGDDPSFTYIDPFEGEIRGNDSVQAHLYMNAENLRNGEHRSYVNIYTNDYNYLNTSISMNVWVTGHEGELYYERDQDINGIVYGQENEITIPVSNEGLGDLEMQGVEFPSEEWALVVDTAYTLMPTQSHNLLLKYTPSSTGYKAENLTIKTDAGEYPLFLNIGVAEPSSMSVDYGSDTLRASLNRGEETTITFTLKNTDANVPLDFDIYSESFPDGEHAKSRIYTYDTVRFNDASRWDPINEFAPIISYFYQSGVPATFKFPFYEEVVEEISISDEAWVFASTANTSIGDLPNSYLAPAVMMPLGDYHLGGGILEPVATYYYGFGDRFVIQADSLTQYDGGGKSSFQTAIFKDGSIEYRYRVIDSMIYKESIIGIQDFQADSSCVIKSSTDTTFILSDNDVIRFTPRESASFLGRVSTDKGRLMPGETLDITVTLNPDSSELITGSYLNKIRIGANTLEKEYYVPVVLDVTGRFDSITVDTNMIDFGIVNTLTPYTDTLWITNHSDDSTKMLSFNTENKIVGLQLRDGLSDFGPRESKRLILDFIPEFAGEVNELITLSTSQGDLEINFTASSSIVPTFAHNAKESYHFDLDEESKSEVFTLTNTSATTPLKYQIFGGSFVSLTETSVDSKSATINTTDDYEAEILERLTKYGLADSAYSWEMSNGENAVQYYLDNLITLDSAVRLEFPKNGFVLVELESPFPFYGETYDTVWINENGYLTVIEPEISADPIVDTPLSKDDGVRGCIIPFWGDWTDPETESAGIFMLNQKDRMVIQWRNVYSLDSYSPGEVSFEVILFNDGRIKFLYERINDYMGLFDYALESPTEDNNIDLGREGWEINHFGVYPDSTAITLTPAHFGELLPNTSIDIQINASPSYMLGGDDYTQSIIIRTDAVNPSNDTIEVTATVTEKELSIASDTIDFGTHYYEDNMPVTSHLWVNNRGRLPVYIKNAVGYKLPDFELQNELGYVIEQYGNGELKTQHCLLPGEMIFYNVSYIPDSTALENLYGTHYSTAELKLYDGTTFEMITKVTFKERPDLTSEAKDTSFVMTQSETDNFVFEFKNEGADTLEYTVKGIFSGDNITYDDPLAAPGAEFDQVSYLEDDNADGFYSNLAGEPFIITLYHNPVVDFDLTHVRVYTKLAAEKDYTIRVQVYEYQMDTLYGRIHEDTMGVLISSEEYRFQDDLGEKWRYMSMPETVKMEAGKQYLTNVIFPSSLYEPGVMGTSLCYDAEKLEKFFYSSGSSYYYMYGFNSSYMISAWIPMLDLISGASTEGFMNFSPEIGKLAPNETQQVEVEVDATVASAGINIGTVSIDATNVFDHYEFSVQADVNAKPIFTYKPTNDTLVIQEKVPYVGSYLIEDPEGDAITCTIIDDDGLDVVLIDKDYVSTDNEVLVQLSFNTGWEDQGIYDVVLEARDHNDNVNTDTLTVEVYNINRAPIMNFDEGIIINIAHTEVFQKNMNEMFTDPDNDELTFQIGNGNPELYEMALLNDELLIAPIEVGVGLVIFAADDGYVDGYTGYYYYVYIIDDASVEATQDGIMPTLTEETPIEKLFTAPNPTTGNSGVYFNLEEEMNISIELYDMQGQFIKQVINGNMQAGNRYVETSLHDLSSGVYLYKVTIGDDDVQTIRIVKD